MSILPALLAAVAALVGTLIQMTDQLGRLSVTDPEGFKTFKTVEPGRKSIPRCGIRFGGSGTGDWQLNCSGPIQKRRVVIGERSVQPHRGGCWIWPPSSLWLASRGNCCRASSRRSAGALSTDRRQIWTFKVGSPTRARVLPRDSFSIPSPLGHQTLGRG